jgi:hypothetical protein
MDYGMCLSGRLPPLRGASLQTGLKQTVDSNKIGQSASAVVILFPWRAGN